MVAEEAIVVTDKWNGYNGAKKAYDHKVIKHNKMCISIEKDTELLINRQLENLQWVLDPKDPDRNVYLQKPKTQKQKQQLEGKRPDYILYEKNTDNPLVIIEAKRSGSNMRHALDQGVYYAKKLGAPIVYATDGIFSKTLYVNKGEPLFINDEEVNELIREHTILKFTENNTNKVNTLAKKVVNSRHELINVFKRSNDYLRSEGLTAGVERFSEFSNILFLKLISELEDIKDSLGNYSDSDTIDRAYRWNFFRHKKGKQLLDYVNDTVLKQFQMKYDQSIFQPLRIKKYKTLENIIDELDGLQLTDINADIKGDAFEYFLRSYNIDNKDLGEYFTPRHIVKAIVKLLNPQLGETIYDPFCGTGGMLIESFKHIQSSMPHTESALRILKEETIYGNEFTNTVRITKMNMILMGDGHSNVEQKDSLANPVDNKYDVVITNMPFSQNTAHFSFYDVPLNAKKNGDSICVQHCIKAARDNGGKVCIIVPEGFLFDNKYKKTREYLLNTCKLETIISLPKGVFLPYTGVKTNIIILTKGYKKRQSYYWYFDLKNDGFTLDNKREKMDKESDLNVLLSERKSLFNNDEDSLLKIGYKKIYLEDIINSNYNLVGAKYANHIYESKYKLVKLGDTVDLLRGPFGSSIKKSVCVSEGYKLYEQQNVINNDFTIGQYYLDEKKFKELEKFEIKEKDILITCAGTIGRVSIVPKSFEKGIINSVLMRLRIKTDKILPEYLLIVLQGEVMQNEMVNQSIGTGIKNMRPSKELKQLNIPLPPLNKQYEIIDSVKKDKLTIEDHRKSIEEMEKNIQNNINNIWITR